MESIASTSLLIFFMEVVVYLIYYLLCLIAPLQGIGLLLLHVVFYTLLMTSFDIINNNSSHETLHVPPASKKDTAQSSVSTTEELHAWHMREHQVEIAFTRKRCEEILQLCLDMHTLLRTCSSASSRAVSPSSSITWQSVDYQKTDKQNASTELQQVPLPFTGRGFHRKGGWKQKSSRSLNSFFCNYAADAASTNHINNEVSPALASNSL